eukprot:1919569-Rhodomonas_salina.1
METAGMSLRKKRKRNRHTSEGSHSCTRYLRPRAPPVSRAREEETRSEAGKRRQEEARREAGKTRKEEARREAEKKRREKKRRKLRA